MGFFVSLLVETIATVVSGRDSSFDLGSVFNVEIRRYLHLGFSHLEGGVGLLYTPAGGLLLAAAYSPPGNTTAFSGSYPAKRPDFSANS